MKTDIKPIIFKKRESTIIKGVVILLMIIHHLFGFENNFFEIKPSWTSFGGFGKICVSVYAFLSGYGLYASVKKNTNFNSLKRIFKLLFRYWICLTFIILCDFLCGDYIFSFSSLLKTFLNYSCFYFSINPYAWFILPYFVFVIFLPIFYSVVDRISNILLRKITEILFLAIPIAFSIISNILFQEVNYIYNTLVYSVIMMIPFFLIGSYFSKYSIFEKIPVKTNLKLLNIIVSFLLLILVFWGRKKISYFVYGMNILDIVYAPVFVLGIIILINSIRLKWLYILLEKLGDMSTNMWLVHFVFCQGVFQKFIFKINSEWLILITTLVLCIVLSYFTDIIYNTFLKIKRKKIFNSF